MPNGCFIAGGAFGAAPMMSWVLRDVVSSLSTPIEADFERLGASLSEHLSAFLLHKTSWAFGKDVLWRQVD